MRKRYSRSYTVLSFLTMFSYREHPFGGGFLGLTDGKTYECVGVEYDLLRIIDDEGEDYLYSASAPAPLNGKTKPGKWEVVEDDERGTLSRLISKENA